MKEDRCNRCGSTIILFDDEPNGSRKCDYCEQGKEREKERNNERYKRRNKDRKRET